MYTFKKFTAVGGKFTINITLAKPGGFSLSSGFYNRYGISEYKAIFLYFDEKEQIIAIKFLKDVEDGSFKLKHREDGKGGYASAISFIKSYNLEKFLGTRISPEQYNDEFLGNIFILKIGELGK